MNKKVAIVIVLYESIVEDYSAFKKDGIQLILIDNTPDRKLNLSGLKLTYIPLLKNYGIAKAQNIGISKAKELGCDYVIFFDQDSTVTESFVDNLLHEYVKVQERNSRIAIMGPIIVNKDSNEEYISFLSNTRRSNRRITLLQ